MSTEETISSSYASTPITSTVVSQVRGTLVEAGLNELRIRPDVTAPAAMSTLPSISTEDMATLQRNDKHLGRLWLTGRVEDNHTSVS